MHTTWTGPGIVSGRVALLLRSAEVKPVSVDLSPLAAYFVGPSNYLGCYSTDGEIAGRQHFRDANRNCRAAYTFGIETYQLIKHN